MANLTPSRQLAEGFVPLFGANKRILDGGPSKGSTVVLDEELNTPNYVPNGDVFIRPLVLARFGEIVRLDLVRVGLGDNDRRAVSFDLDDSGCIGTFSITPAVVNSKAEEMVQTISTVSGERISSDPNIWSHVLSQAFIDSLSSRTISRIPRHQRRMGAAVLRRTEPKLFAY